MADIIPPEQLQTLADNVTDALLPSTPENFDLTKFMGRWFEGINSPRATEQRCVVHHCKFQHFSNFSLFLFIVFSYFFPSSVEKFRWNFSLKFFIFKNMVKTIIQINLK